MKKPSRFETNHFNTIQERVLEKQKPIDKLIELALSNHDEERIAKQAQVILDEMRESQSISQRLSDLEKVAQLPALFDTQELQTEITNAINETAEQTSDELRESKDASKKLGLNAVLATLHTWDQVRTPETDLLCVETLEVFKGYAQPTLLNAFITARSEDIPFEEAHNQVITGQRAA